MKTSRSLETRGTAAMIASFLAWLVDKFETEREGQGLVEYALVIILVSIVAMVALRALGVQLGAIYDQISAAIAAG
jgi:pilus assembly protein Flp/PilA